MELLPQKDEELAAGEVDECGSGHESELGNPRIESAGDQERPAKEPGGEGDEADQDEEGDFALPGMAARREDEEDVAGVVDQRSGRKGDKVGEDGVALLRLGRERRVGKVVVGGKPGVGERGEESEMDDGGCSTNDDVLCELDCRRCLP